MFPGTHNVSCALFAGTGRIAGCVAIPSIKGGAQINVQTYIVAMQDKVPGQS